MSEESSDSVFLLSKKQCLEFIKEAALHEELTASLLKNYDVISILDWDEKLLLRKLCEYYMCNAGIKDLLEEFEDSRPSQYNEERGGDDYVVSHQDGRRLQLIITATDVLKVELESYNISFTVH